MSINKNSNDLINKNIDNLTKENRNNLSNKYTNNLINEKSPYLLQHAHNPVNWYPWCEEAFNKAKVENKPIFLSIGYSTCHWCHVMAHESFEDEEVGAFINDNFIAIKVDREERPDVDSVYMSVCQSLTGRGGWPLTIIMTPDQKPFFAGTYFPKRSKQGMHGVIELLEAVSEQWKSHKEKLISSSEDIYINLENQYKEVSKGDGLNDEIIENSFNQFKHYFDEKNGGFNQAPKFPVPHKLMYLLKYYNLTKDKTALNMATKTLDSMYIGGIFDHIGFGFSRYSTDDRWLVPHFEKMLYDNALLTIAYVDAYELTDNENYKSVAEKTLEYVFRELRSAEGGFYSAEDADSEGEEGKFYVFNPLEIIEILGEEDGKYFNEYFDITPSGNFEGKNIPNLRKSSYFKVNNPKIEEMRKKVLTYRSMRMKIHKDDKILTAWNGLMIAALGKAYRVLGDDKYLDYADKAVEFIYEKLVREDGRLLARYRDGESMYVAYLEDYAYLVWGLIELYNGTYDVKYLKKAIDLNKAMIKLFWDKKDYGFYLYGEDGETLISRPKELYDGAIPSGNSVAAYNIYFLNKITNNMELDEILHKQMDFIAKRLQGGEINYSFYLISAILHLNPSKELKAIIKNEDDLKELKRVQRESHSFNLSIVVKTQENSKELEEVIEFIEGYKLENDKSTYYLCANNTCTAAFNDIEKLRNMLRE